MGGTMIPFVYLWLVPVALVVYVWLDLYVIRWAQLHTVVAGVPVRVRFGSLVNVFTRADATVIGGTIHVKRGKRTFGLLWLASEVGHVIQERSMGRLRYLWQVVTNLKGLEHEAHQVVGPRLQSHPDVLALRAKCEARYNGTMQRGG